MSPEAGEIKVTIRAIDKVSPVIRRIRWHLWLWRYADRIIVTLLLVIVALVAVLSFVLGRLTA